MNENEFLILLQAKLDEAKSKGNVNADIEKLQSQLDKLKLQAEINPNSIKNITQQLSKILNQPITLDNIQIGNGLKQGISSTVKDIKKDINGALGDLKRLNAYDIIKNLNLDRASIGDDVKTKIRSLVTDINSLGIEAAKTNADPAWENLIGKVTELGELSKKYGKIRENVGLENAEKFAGYFEGKVISTGYKNSGLSGTDFSASQLKTALSGMRVEFSATKKEAIELNSIWEEMCQETGRMDLLNVTNTQDQLKVVIEELSRAKSLMHGEEGLIPHPDPSGYLNTFMSNVEKTRDIVANLEKETSNLTQKESQSSISNTNTIIQNEDKKQQAYQETERIKEQLINNGNIIQNIEFSHSFNSKDEAEQYFKTLSNIVSIQGKLGENKNLESFIVEVKNAEGVVEKLTYKYNELTNVFEYSGGSINNSGVIKQINAIASKADSLQTKLDKLKANYSDANSSRPIKDSNNISALSQQYDKVAQAIENVRNADSSTFSSMVSNAQQEITVLESMITQFRNAENVATQMKSVDISSGIAQAQERLGKLKANASGFEQMTQTINELDTAIKGVGDKSSLDNFLNNLKTAEAQLGRVKAEVKELSQIDKIQLSIGTNGDTTTQIKVLQDNFTKLGLSADEVKTKMNGVDTELIELKTLLNNGASNSEIISQFNKLQLALNETQNNLKATRSEFNLLVTDQQRLSKANVIEAWNLKNKNATHEVRSANEAYINSLRDLNTEMTRVQFNNISDGFSRVKNSMTALGKISTAVKGQIVQASASVISFMSLSRLVMQAVNWFTKMPSTVMALDTALVDLKKTANMSAQELENFYYESNKVAKQMGVTTEEIINQASSWSRLGFNTAEAATQMAKLSSQFALISPGLSVDDATSGLVSVMKSYDISVSDVLDGIESKINIVGNNLALSNANIVRMLQDSVSAMAEGRNTLEETIALEAAAYEITQNESVGNGFKTVSLRLRGMNEETEELDESLKTIQGDLYELTGVSIMENDNTYKSTYQILKEISEVWESLTDKTRAEALELMFGKQRSNIGAAVLKNFEAAEKAMDLMANSAGNADAELSVVMDSIEYKMNRLAETSTSVAQNLFKRDDMKTVIDALTSVMSVIDALTSKLGLFGSIGLGAGLFSGFKNVGSPKMFGFNLSKNIPTVC